MPNKDIDFNLINQAIKLARHRGVYISRKQAYQMLLDGGLIKRNGMPTPYALQNGYVQAIPIRKLNKENTSQRTRVNESKYYHHLLSTIPSHYISLITNHQDSIPISNNGIKTLKRTQHLFLKVPFHKYSTRDLGATIYFSYKLLYEMKPNMNKDGIKMLRNGFNHICKMYTERIGNTNKALDKIGQYIKEVKYDDGEE